MTLSAYDKTVVLLPLSGSNNGTTFTGYAKTPSVITVNGDAKTTTSDSKFYGSCLTLDGTGDYLSFGANSEYRLGTGDFTLEFWIKPNASQTQSYPVWVSNNTSWASNAWQVAIGRTGVGLKVQVWVNNYNSGSALITGSSTLSSSAWTHVAITRSGNNFTLWVNGASDGTGTSSAAMDAAGANNFYVGLPSTNSPKGLMNDVRFIVGEALYTADFSGSLPGAFIKTISGTVKDDTNTGCIRTVRAYPRTTGAPMASTTSAADGTYSLTVPDVEHSVIVLDDDAGTLYNDLIKRATPV